MEWVDVVDVVVVNALRWLESHVVVTWVVVLSEAHGLSGIEQWAGIPTKGLQRMLGFGLNLPVGEVGILASFLD